jgi:hypothetical protein
MLFVGWNNSMKYSQNTLAKQTPAANGTAIDGIRRLKLASI